jgi:hypothetical protein
MGKKTKSQGLRERQTRDGGGRSINNKDAKRLDNSVKNVCGQIFEEIQREYPTHKFTWEQSISKEDIAKKALGKAWRKYKPHSPRSTGPKPDGGIIYTFDGEGNKLPILIAEAKKQGTNNARMGEGKKKQAKGNAIERAYKNVEEMKIFTRDLDYFPYVIIAHGCDFEDGSSILDRLDALTKYHPRNKDYTLHGDQKTTVYIQEEEFKRQEIYKHLKGSVVKCIKHVSKRSD